MYVCICVTAAQRSFYALPHLRFATQQQEAPSRCLLFSWTTCEWELEPELVSSTGDLYALREQATQRKCWLEWMDEYAASGAIKWKPNVVATHLDGNEQPEVRMTALTGKVKGHAVKVNQRQKWEIGVGNIVRHHSLVQYDMLGRRGWMTGDPAGLDSWKPGPKALVCVETVAELVQQQGE